MRFNNFQILVGWSSTHGKFLAKVSDQPEFEAFGDSRSEAVGNLESKLAAPEIIEVRYGLDSKLIRIKSGMTVGDLILDTNLSDLLGFGPYNINVLENGVALSFSQQINPGRILVIETAANEKAVGTPKEHKCERWRKKNGIAKEPAKGDHWRWLIGNIPVQVNYKNGHLDFASLKAIARVLNRSVRDLFLEMQAT
jgi:predicted RNase H-like HicB family nuclease